MNCKAPWIRSFNKTIAVTLIAAFGLPQLALAGSASGIVTYMVPFDVGGIEVVVFRLSVMNSDKPACNVSNRFVMTAANNPKFKTYLAALMAASFSQTPIYVYGSGSCSIYDNASENLAYICLGSQPYPC